MNAAVEQLVRDTVELTGADMPELMEADAPVLSEEALADDGDEGGYYLVGIIGGKDIGKSALVNALVGRDITAITSHGPGTEMVIAYAHRSQEAALRELLDREVTGRYRLVTHDTPALRRQVLLDLPDIDSHYESHVAVTRAMLRHMLFPVWMQSVEKYADLQPQQMLQRVAAGNDARNFVFCLNKADQLDANGRGPDGSAASGDLSASREARELREDCAARLAKALGLPAPPNVYLISAKYPDRYEFPKLRALLAQEKEESVVRQSKALAAKRQDRSLLDWLNRQNLTDRAARLGRLREEAEELTAERLAVPLVERVAPKIAEDPANRAALADDILSDRVARWPLVNLVHTLMAPLFVLVRTMGAKNVTPLQGADALIEFHLKSHGWSPSGAVQATFAQLRQSHPAVGSLYEHRRLWEEMPSQQAADDLCRRLVSAVERQRTAARERLIGHGLGVGPAVRWLLTIGALLWFPLIQPVLQETLADPSVLGQFRLILKAIIQVLGADYLLKSAGFLLIYYAVLWLALRWNTHRQVARLLSRWRLADDPDPELSLAAQSLQWVDGLTEPVQKAHERLAELANRAERLKGEVARVTKVEKAA
jgi:hypothetical protein